MDDVFFSVMTLLAASAAAGAGPAQPQEKVVLVIHGGAGVKARKEMTPELERQYRQELERALLAGHAVLQRKDGTALDAVEAAIKPLEDSPLFNAGRGAVFNRDGRNELSASLMSGKDKRAGAVAGVTRSKNPISAARAVMEKSEHVLMVADGADRFAASAGVPQVSPTWFWTEGRWKQLQDELAEEAKAAKPGAKAGRPAEVHFGTVGAVALDRNGNLAAGTSTGGLCMQLPGRVGDSPIIGAGTYAEDESCAVSATGHGEVFIRHSVAYDIAARVKYKRVGIQTAVEEAFRALPQEPEGVGGVIVLDKAGRFVAHYVTEGMYRGWVTESGKVHVAIYGK